VLTCEVPQPVVFTWQIAPDRTPQPDPDRASEVEVVFTGSAEDGTDVALEYRDGFEAAGAWPRALESFAAAATRSTFPLCAKPCAKLAT